MLDFHFMEFFHFSMDYKQFFFFVKIHDSGRVALLITIKSMTEI